MVTKSTEEKSINLIKMYEDEIEFLDKHTFGGIEVEKYKKSLLKKIEELKRS